MAAMSMNKVIHAAFRRDLGTQKLPEFRRRDLGQCENSDEMKEQLKGVTERYLAFSWSRCSDVIIREF